MLLFILALASGGCRTVQTERGVVVDVAGLRESRPGPGPSATERAGAQRVDADRLYTIYTQGLAEGALPDQRFQGRLLLISGRYEGMQTGLARRKYLELGTHDADSFVYARLSPQAESLPATLAPGEPVQLFCIGESALAGNPMVGDCQK